jgi:hypothetical protein
MGKVMLVLALVVFFHTSQMLIEGEERLRYLFFGISVLLIIAGFAAAALDEREGVEAKCLKKKEEESQIKQSKRILRHSGIQPKEKNIGGKGYRKW